MPRGRTDQMIRGMSERENFEREEAYYNHHADRHYEEESESEISGPYSGPRPRGYGESRIVGSHDDYSDYASGPPRGCGGHGAMGGEEYEDSLDDDSLAGESVGPRSGGTRGHRGMVSENYDSFDDDSLTEEPASRRFGGIHGHRGMHEEHYEESFDDDSLAGEFAGTRGARGQHGQGPPYSDASCTDTTTEHSTDDECDYCPRGTRSGIAASGHDSAPSSRRWEVSPSPRHRRMYPGGRNPGVHQDGGRAPGSYDSGRDLDRRRY